MIQAGLSLLLLMTKGILLFISLSTPNPRQRGWKIINRPLKPGVGKCQGYESLLLLLLHSCGQWYGRGASGFLQPHHRVPAMAKLYPNGSNSAIYGLHTLQHHAQRVSILLFCETYSHEITKSTDTLAI